VARLVLLALLASALAAAAPALAAGPSLTVVRRSPLVVRGASFRPLETVTLTSTVGRVRVRTTAKGTFVASFPGTTDRCTGGRLLAVSVNGERVTLRLPLTMCAPAAAG
jgi:hypothetical protein